MRNASKCDSGLYSWTKLLMFGFVDFYTCTLVFKSVCIYTYNHCNHMFMFIYLKTKVHYVSRVC